MAAVSLFSASSQVISPSGLTLQVATKGVSEEEKSSVISSSDKGHLSSRISAIPI